MKSKSEREFEEQGGEKLNFGQQLLLLRKLKEKRELEEAEKAKKDKKRRSRRKAMSQVDE